MYNKIPFHPNYAIIKKLFDSTHNDISIIVPTEDTLDCTFQRFNVKEIFQIVKSILINKTFYNIQHVFKSTKTIIRQSLV